MPRSLVLARVWVHGEILVFVITMISHYRSVALSCNSELRINKRREVAVCALVYYTKH
jgi:hypothetical protein